MGKFVPFGKKEEKGKEKAPAKGGKPAPFGKAPAKAGKAPAKGSKDMKKC